MVVIFQSPLVYYHCLSAIRCNASRFAAIENGETVQNKTMYAYLEDVQLLCYDGFLYYLCLSAIRCNASRFATIENGETVQNKTMYAYLEDVQLLCYDGFLYYLCLSAIRCNASRFATIENGETVQNKTMHDYLEDVQLLCYDGFLYYLCLSAIRCNASRFATIENGETVQNKTMYDYLEDVQLLCYDGFIPINGQDSIMCLSPSSFTDLYVSDFGCEGKLGCVFFTVVNTLDKGQLKTLILWTKVDQKLFATEFLIAICHQTGVKWQSTALFLAILDARSSIVKSILDCHLPSMEKLVHGHVRIQDFSSGGSRSF